MAREVGNGVQPLGAARQGEGGFEANVSEEMGIIGGHVGRVGNDEVIIVSIQGVEPVSLSQYHIGDAMVVEVLSGYRQSRCRDVGGDDSAIGSLAGKGQSDGSGAGSKIGDAPLGPLGDAFQRHLHQTFGVRARNQYRRTNR